MAQQLKELAKIMTEVGREKIPGMRERYVSRQLRDESEIKQARQLATRSFVALGKIDAAEVDEEGILLHDTILPLSTFFATFDRNDQIQASARLIWKPETSVDDLRLPLEQIEARHAEYLLSHELGAVAEIGSLAKERGAPTVTTLKMLRSLWAFADAHEVDTFVCGLEPRLYPRYQSMFGNALTPLTDHTIEFPGIHGPQRPLMIDVRRAVVRQRETTHRSAAQKLERFVVGRFITRDAPGVLLKSQDEDLQNLSAPSY